MDGKSKKFFVYGTLKVGGYFSHGLNPFRKSSIRATIKGFNLYDLGAFPGILPGDGEVFGELHEYDEYDKVLAIMDHIEGYNGTEDSLYMREEVEVELEDGETETALVYVFNQEDPPEATKIKNGTWKV